MNGFFFHVVLAILTSLAVGILLLTLVHTGKRVGYGLFYATLGIFKYLHFILSNTLKVSFPSSYIFHPGSGILFLGVIFAVLLIYVIDSALEARKAIYTLIILNLIFFIFQTMIYFFSSAPGIEVVSGISRSLFTLNPRIFFGGLILLFVDSFAIMATYEIIRSYLKHIFLQFLATMAIIVLIHSFLFSFWSFIGTKLFTVSLISGVLTKLIPMLIFSVLYAWYYRYFGQKIIPQSELRLEIKDLFHLLTYRKKYEDTLQEKLEQQKELAESERFNQLLFNEIPVGLLLMTEDGTIQECNRVFCAMLGYEKEFLNDQNIKNFIKKPDNDKWFVSYFLSALTTEAEYLHHSGKTVTVIQHSAKIKRKNKTLIWVSLEDISPRKAVERKLMNSELKFRTLADYTLDWEYWETPAGELVYVSPSVEEFTGLKSDDFYQNPNIIMDLLQPDDVARYQQHIQLNHQDIGKNHSAVFNFRIKRTDGSVVDVIHYCRPIYDDAGNYLGHRVSNRDVTGQKKLEEQLRLSQKMDAIGQLSAGIAHDFNNLLTVINGYSEMILLEIQETDKFYKAINQIRMAGEQAQMLTGQLLAFSRKQIVQVEPIDLNSEILNMEKMLKRLIGENIRLVTILDDHLKLIEADHGQVNQVIMNLVINARDAISNQGQLTIETGNINLDEDFCKLHPQAREGDFVFLNIVDNGCGMDKQTVSRIFEPFYTTKEEGKGTGLGLSTVYGIVKQANGFIIVYSEPGKGTAFKLFFPVMTGGDIRKEKLAEELTSLAGTETIMVVEDETAVLRLIDMTLRKNGYTVIKCSDGKAAIEYSDRANSPIALLLTDVVLPDISGKELVTRFREKHPDTKICFMSGYTDKTIVEHGLILSTENFIQKPFTRIGLLTKIRRIIEQK